MSREAKSPARFRALPVATGIVRVLASICLLAPSKRALKRGFVIAMARGAESKRVPFAMLSIKRHPSPSTRWLMISFRCSEKSGLSETGVGMSPVAIVQMTSPANVLPFDMPSP